MDRPASPDRRGHYVGVLSLDLCMFHDLSAARAADSIGHYLSTMPRGSLMVFGVFSTETEALCWLTDPVRKEAICTVSVDGAPAAAGGGPGWLAICNSSLSSSFDLRHRGAQRALSLLSPLGAGVSVVRHFAVAEEALLWLAGQQPRDLLDVLGAALESDERQRAVTTDEEHDPVEVCNRVGTNKRPAPSSSFSSSGAAVQLHSSPRCGSEPNDDRSPRKRRKVGADDISSRPTAPTVHGLAKEQRRVSGGKQLKPKLSLEGGPPAALNPPSTTRDQAETTSSLNDIHILLKKFTAFYDNLYGPVPSTGDARSCTAGATDATKVTTVPSASVNLSKVSGTPTRPADSACVETAPLMLSPTDTFSSSSDAPSSPRYRPPTIECPHGCHPSIVPAVAAVGGPHAPSPSVMQHDGVVELGPLSSLANTGDYDSLCERLASLLTSTFVSGGPGVGKTFVLRKYVALLRKTMAGDGEVVECAPTGSAAQTAKGDTYHSFFGFGMNYQPSSADGAVEASRLLATNWYSPIRRRLARVQVLFLDEISMIPADRLDMRWQLLVQSWSTTDAACVVYAFGNFMQLRPHHGRLAYHAKCWPILFSDTFLDLRRVHRQ